MPAGSLVVAKFGGSILTGSEGFTSLADEVAKLLREGNRVVVVVSAMKGVTDMLLEILESNGGWEHTLKNILSM